MMKYTCEHCCTKIENLCVRFGAATVLEDVNLHINCREIVALVGPNGAGKTTFLRAMLGEIPYTGTVSFLVKAMPGKKPRIGYVPQKIDFDSDSPISVSDFVATSLGRSPVWMGVTSSMRKRAAAVLAGVSAEHLLDHRVAELSGGELQRVLLALSLTPAPDILLLDEPVSAVDVNGLSLFYRIVDNVRKEHDVSIIMATHDLAGVAPHVDRMILLNRAIIAEGTPREVLADKKMLQTFQLSLWNISRLAPPDGMEQEI